MNLPEFPEIHVYPFEPFLKVLIGHIQNSSISTVQDVAKQYQDIVKEMPVCEFTTKYGFVCDQAAVTTVAGMKCCFSHARTRAAYYPREY